MITEFNLVVNMPRDDHTVMGAMYNIKFTQKEDGSGYHCSLTNDQFRDMVDRLNKLVICACRPAEVRYD